MEITKKLYNYLSGARRKPDQQLTTDMSDFFDNQAGYCLWNMTEEDWKKFLDDNNLMLIEIYPDEKKK